MAEQGEEQTQMTPEPDQPQAIPERSPQHEPIPMVALEPDVMIDEFKGSQPPADPDDGTYIQGDKQR